MRIHIKANIHLPEIPREVEIEGGTLRDLLVTLFSKAHFADQVIDRTTGDLALEGLFDVSLNSVPYISLPGGLDTELHDGDTVGLSLILLGGG
jgi:hypothetical protein